MLLLTMLPTRTIKHQSQAGEIFPIRLVRGVQVIAQMISAVSVALGVPSEKLLETPHT